MGKTTSGKGRDRFFGFAPAPSISEPGFEWKNGHPEGCRRPVFFDLPLFRALPSMLFFVFLRVVF